MLAIRAGRLFDGEKFSGGGATVLLDRGRILAVEHGYPDVGEQWQVIDEPDSTILPGLIDTHVHLVTDSGQSALDRVAGYTDDEIEGVITEGLRRQLAAGVTTVRDLGDRRYAALDRRDRQRSGRATGPEPTILASGPPLTSPDGHCADMGGEVRGVPAVSAAVRERIERRVDAVKIMASGGMNTVRTDVTRPQFTVGEIRAAVDLAHDAAIGVSVHAHALAAVEQALEVGVECIEHCSCLTGTGLLLTDELLDRLAASGAAVGAAMGMPPATAFSDAPPNARAMMERAGVTLEAVNAMRMDMLGRMYRAGVTLVTGADSGIAPWLAHGLLRRSIATMVEFSGSTTAALAASTSVAARACAVQGRKGLLRAEYDADVLVVQGDLQADIAALGNVRTVVLGGAVVG